jgi:outer membrane lipoprotein-sorting protein
MKKALVVILVLFASFSLFSCASGPDVKQQAYAKLKDSRTFETDFPAVWHAIEDTLRNYKVVERDPNKVDANEMRRIKHRTLETDWVYTRSTDKYVEYKVNDLPRKTYLQTRLKYKIDAQSVLGGVKVTVNTNEEIEKLKDDGSPNGWDEVDNKDTSRANDMLDKFNTAILAAPPTSEI